MKNNLENTSTYTTVSRARIKADTVMHCIFVAVIGMLLLLPSIKFNFKDTISKVENRTLSPLPSLQKDGKINTSFFRDCDKFIGDRCGFRLYATALVSTMDRFSILSTNKRVIFGKDDWLFFTGDGNTADFFKINLFSDDKLTRFVSIIEDRYRWCNEHGIKFLAVIGTTKHSVYEEYYPFPRPKGMTRCDQIINEFNRIGIPFVFSRDSLIASKSKYSVPLYSKGDTHWNGISVLITFRLIREKMLSFFPNAPFNDIEFNIDISPKEVRTRGDITNNLGSYVYSMDHDIFVKPKGGKWNDYYKYKRKEGEGRSGIETQNLHPDGLPKAVVYRDSFTVALEPFLSTQFSSAKYFWQMFNDDEKEKILQDKPDIVIWEWAERRTNKKWFPAS